MNPKHPLHLRLINSCPEKMHLNLLNGNWKILIFGIVPKNSKFQKLYLSFKWPYADWKVYYETFKGLFIKWTTSGEPPIGSKSHWQSYFKKYKQLFCVRTSLEDPVVCKRIKNHNHWKMPIWNMQLQAMQHQQILCIFTTAKYQLIIYNWLISLLDIYMKWTGSGYMKWTWSISWFLPDPDTWSEPDSQNL